MHSGRVPLAATARKFDVVLTGEEGCMSGSSDRRRTTASAQR